MLTTVKLKSNCKAAKLQLYMGMHGRIRMGSESQSALQRLPVRSVIGSIKPAPAHAGAVIPARMRRCWPAAAIAAQACRTHNTVRLRLLSRSMQLCCAYPSSTVPRSIYSLCSHPGSMGNPCS